MQYGVTVASIRVSVLFISEEGRFGGARSNLPTPVESHHVGLSLDPPNPERPDIVQALLPVDSEFVNLSGP